MASWLHCNKCFLEANKTNPNNFFMTPCGHTFCSTCATKVASSSCLVCGSAGKDIVNLNNESDFRVKMHFFDIHSLLAKVMQINKFQEFQRESLLSSYRLRDQNHSKLVEQSNNLKVECERHRNEKNKLKEDLQEKSKEIRRLTRELQLLKQNNAELLKNKTPQFPHQRVENVQASPAFLTTSSGGNHKSFEVDCGSLNMQLNGVFKQTGAKFTPPPDLRRQPVQNIFKNNSNMKTPTANPSPMSLPPKWQTADSSCVSRRAILPVNPACSNASRIGFSMLNQPTNHSPSLSNARGLSTNTSSQYPVPGIANRKRNYQTPQMSSSCKKPTNYANKYL